MKVATASEGPAAHLWMEWPSPEGSNQRNDASEAIDALFILTGDWLEVLALEVRVACYDREIYTETTELRLRQPYHLLVRKPRFADVSINQMYKEVVETSQAVISRTTTSSWIDKILSQSCGTAERYETSLREVDVLASRTLLPLEWGYSEALALECYAGIVTIRVQRCDGRGAVLAPPAGYIVRQPVVISIESIDDALRLTVNVYWSPWVGELTRPDSPLAKGIALLESRGWYRSLD